MAELAIALGIQAFAYAAFRYRSRQGVSPDGKFYLAMQAGERVPAPYARRWLVPLLLGWTGCPWSVFSAVAFIATGPLIYALTGSLVCVWLWAWLPGWAINVRFPVLTDQAAMALMLGAVVAYQHQQYVLAGVLLFLSGQAKEPTPLFGAALCLSPWMGAIALCSTTTAILVGKYVSVPGREGYMLHPFSVARTKHDPLDWREMLLPWGSVAALACFAEHDTTALVAGVSLCMGYGQLLLANDSVRLYQWAAPAVLLAVAPVQVGVWIAPLLVAHPFLCGASKRV